MKSIFYVSAVLMLSAAIYGFVDYKKSKNDKAFRSLYKKTEPTGSAYLNPAKTIDEPTALREPKKEAIEKKEIPPVKTISTKSSNRVSSKKTVKSKKIQSKFFSRAALEKFEPPVVETKKEEAKQ